jgi:hypothetical protein
MAIELPAEEDPIRVRASLRRTVIRMGVPDLDADEVVDRALEKALIAQRPQTSGVSLGRRAGQALKDERIAYLRRCAARPRRADGEVPDSPGGDDPTTAIEMVQSCERLRELLGNDALQYIFWDMAGFSEREIGEMPGWDTLKAGRVRRSIARKGAVARDLVLQLLTPELEKEAS